MFICSAYSLLLFKQNATFHARSTHFDSFRSSSDDTNVFHQASTPVWWRAEPRAKLTPRLNVRAISPLVVASFSSV